MDGGQRIRNKGIFVKTSHLTFRHFLRILLRTRPLRLMVRTAAFQAVNRGSIPLEATIKPTSNDRSGFVLRIQRRTQRCGCGEKGRDLVYDHVIDELLQHVPFRRRRGSRRSRFAEVRFKSTHQITQAFLGINVPFVTSLWRDERAAGVAESSHVRPDPLIHFRRRIEGQRPVQSDRPTRHAPAKDRDGPVCEGEVADVPACGFRADRTFDLHLKPLNTGTFQFIRCEQRDQYRVSTL